MNHNLFILAGRYISNYWLPLRTYSRFFSQSHYDVLKVSPSCSAKEIREAFLILSKKTHPDKHLNDPSMHEKFVRLNEAYSTLINPSSRRAYDLTLFNERKLNPPYGRKYGPYSQTYTGSRTSTYDTYHSPKSSHSNNSEYYKNPFSWDFKNENEKYEQNSPYRRGVKKFSNTVIVGCLLTISIVGAVVQLFTIRHSFLINQEKMLERSHHYSMLHKQAQERAKLYGNAHQIEVLKRNTSGFFDGNDTDMTSMSDSNDTTEQIISIKESMNNISEDEDESRVLAF